MAKKAHLPVNELRIQGYVYGYDPLKPKKGNRPIVRLKISHKYYRGWGKFDKVRFDAMSYGDHALAVMKQDIRVNDLVLIEGKLKADSYYSTDKVPRIGVMANTVTILKRGNKHPDGGTEKEIGVPPGI